MKFSMLQLFAEGTTQAPTGETAADAGQQEAVGENRAQTQDAAAPQTPPKMTWEEVKADPEFNRQIQAIIRQRLRSAGKTEADPAQQAFRQHIEGLEAQAKALQGTFPGFDLRKELRNPAFARMTAPDVGIGVEDAYYALHRGEIQSAAMQVTAQKTAQMLSDAIRAGQYRPVENGTGAQSAAPTAPDYRNASPQQRAALKKRIREAHARGEKLYPNG